MSARRSEIRSSSRSPFGNTRLPSVIDAAGILEKLRGLAQQRAVLARAVGDRRQIRLAEHLVRHAAAKRLEQRQLLGARLALAPSCPSSGTPKRCARRTPYMIVLLVHSKSKALQSASRSRGSANFARRVLMNQPCAPDGVSSGRISFLTRPSFTAGKS